MVITLFLILKTGTQNWTPYLVSPRWRYLHQTNWWKESTGDKKKSEFLLNMEELFRYYLSNIIILRIWFLQDGDTYTRRIGGKNQQGIRKNQSFY